MIVNGGGDETPARDPEADRRNGGRNVTALGAIGLFLICILRLIKTSIHRGYGLACISD